MNLFTLYIKCLFLLLLSASCTKIPYEEPPPKLAIINIIDQNGLTETISSPERMKQYETVDFLQRQPYKKVMRIYARNAEGDILAYLTSYHPNGQPWQYLEVVNCRAYGLYQERYPSGTLKLTAMIIGGEADLDTAAQKTWLFEGPSEVWDEQGHKIADLPYEKGVLEGICFYYHPKGALWKKIPCHNGMRQGEQEIYLESGELLLQTPYTNDEPNGTSYRFWPEGDLAAEEVFQIGQLISGCYWDKKGQLITQITQGNGKRVLFGKETVFTIQNFVNGYPEGKTEIYAQDGSLTSYYHQKEGLKHGEEIQVYSGTLSPKLLITWNRGKIQGITKTWYKSGQLESQKELSDNKKNGLLTAWYTDGSLMMIEDYDQDKLVKGEYYRRGEKLPVSEVIKGNGTATFFDSEGTFLRRVSYLHGAPDNN